MMIHPTTTRVTITVAAMTTAITHGPSNEDDATEVTLGKASEVENAD